MEVKNNATNQTKTKHSAFIGWTQLLSVLFLIACLVGGVILGNKYAIVTTHGSYYTYTEEEFNTLLMLTSWVIGFVTFVIMYGIACIVENTENKY